MSSVTVSVILPSVSDISNFNRLCSTILTGRLEVEVLVCTSKHTLTSTELSTEYADQIKVISSVDIDEAFRTALASVSGQFVVFSDENAVYAPEAFEKMIVASKGRFAVCNAAVVSGDGAGSLMCDNFTVADFGCISAFCNCIIAKDIIVKNSVVPCGADNLSIRMFIADCMRYENCSCLNEVLVYLSSAVIADGKNAVAYIVEYAEIFKQTGNSAATLYFVNVILSAYMPCLTDESFLMLKSAIKIFKDDLMLVEYIRSKYMIDMDILCSEYTTLADFKYEGTGIFYKEVMLPFLPDTAVRNFYAGKFGLDVLKKCFGAWMFYKFYRRKDDFIKKIGCKLSLKLLGGDFVG